ncbi:hypothetical protein SAMN05421675_0201 [Pasteurella multocida]|uniref:DUF6378 domain-containing protein n=1 Tax=Pasteurella multocida TaxID=747 RepID=UPI0008E692CE|nr:DUF6378 domain-containing protein [Pasteurella multocida]MDY0642759.1 DUF6378 domain-containing protein [Pasteurella multocida]MEE3748079.1 DUF6378 domain-containing protein [Pasteurella multocida]SFO72659.1 hypothetical protein SAMN05421675_0201 [Pasteurella multocida]VEE38065.1 Uncharacterised protein [Pasteurella multocida subsp. gallicida]HDR0998466.1 hypothetical protein [Pasteurella multocida]
MIKEVLDERETTHGDFHAGAMDFKELMNVINSGKSNMDSSQYYALTMIATKIVRIVNGNPHEVDHWRDIVGYATLGGRLNIEDEPLTPQSAVDILPVVNYPQN